MSLIAGPRNVFGNLNPAGIEVLQLDTVDCGLACLVSIHAFYGRRTTISEIRCILESGIAGTNMLALARAAENMGYQTHGIKADSAFLSQIDNPSIAHVQLGEYLHYVVIYAIGQRSVQIMDPARGRLRRVPRSVFMRQWTGYLLLIGSSSRGESITTSTKKSNNKMNSRVVSWEHPKMGWSAWLVVVFLQLGLMGLVFYASIKQTPVLWMYSLAYLFVLELFVMKLQRAALNELMRKEWGWLKNSFKKMIRLPQHFFEGLSVHDLISRAKDPATCSRYQERRFLELPLDLAVLATLFGMLLIQSRSQLVSILFLIPLLSSFVTFSSSYFKVHERSVSEKFYQEYLSRMSWAAFFESKAIFNGKNVLRIMNQVEEKLFGKNTLKIKRRLKLTLSVLQLSILLFFVSLFFLLNIPQTFDLFQLLVSFYFVLKLRKVVTLLLFRSRFERSRKRLQEMLNFR